MTNTRKAAVFYTRACGCLCKIILSIIAIAIITPTYAKDSNNHIQPSPTNDCVETTLGTATGPANLEADWTANTINLEWYNEDTKLTVPTTSNTCTYDSGITLPSTNPEKTGYTFRGWQVRQCSLRGLDTSIGTTWDPEHTQYINSRGVTGNVYYVMGDTSNLNLGEWSVKFSYGTVKGISRCSFEYSTNRGDIGAPTDDLMQDGAKYCWCQATDFVGENRSNYCQLSDYPWVYDNYDYVNKYNCALQCAHQCAYNLAAYSNFRRAIYGITQ